MRTFGFEQKWQEFASPDNIYWISVDPMACRVQHSGGKVTVGKECKSLAEIEGVIALLHRELDEALAEARTKLQPDPAPGGFQTRVTDMRSPRRS